MKRFQCLSRCICFCIVILAITFNGVAQKVRTTQLLSYDTCIFLDLNKSDIIEVSFDNDSIISYATYDDSVTLTSINIYNNTSFKMPLRKYMKYVYRICSNQEYLLVFTKLNYLYNIIDVFLFKKNNNNGYEYVKTMHLDKMYSCREAYFLNNGTLLVVDGYLSRQKNYNTFYQLVLFDIEEEKEIKRTSPYLELPMTNYFGPTKLVTVTDNSILFSQKGIYKIYEYDYNLNLIDSFYNKDLKWKTYPKKKHDKILQQFDEPADRMGIMVQDAYKHSLISQLYYNDGKLLVTYFNPYNKCSISYDVWQKENGHWVLKMKSVSDRLEKKFEKVKKYKRLSWLLGDYFFLHKDRLIVVHNGIPISQAKQFNMSDKEFEQLEKDYYSEHSDKLLIDIFKIKFEK